MHAIMYQSRETPILLIANLVGDIQNFCPIRQNFATGHLPMPSVATLYFKSKSKATGHSSSTGAPISDLRSDACQPVTSDPEHITTIHHLLGLC